MIKTPKDISDLSQCVKVISNKTYIYCVECPGWNTIELVASARVTFSTKKRRVELDDDSIRFFCVRCGCNVEYLLEDHRDKVVEQLRGTL